MAYTKEKFIEKATQVHGGKYDYSKVDYKGYNEDVCIICPEHGEFWQTPHKHLTTRGCFKCPYNNTTNFIEKARKIHGDKYDYSKVNYQGNAKKVIIICPTHGEFLQKPMIHLTKHGCPECGKINSHKSNEQTTEEWIEKAIQVHGNKYDYSKVEYKGWNQKVCIICPIHGEFWQDPTSHIAKHHKRGCPKCGKSIAKTTEQFIQEAIKIHGNKYDYSKVNYINYKTKVCITCPKHGEFYMTPDNHLRGSGCPKCGSINRSKLLSLTNDKFIKKAKEVHGDKYNYSNVNYINLKTKVCIVCPEHGEFWQKPEKHLKGSGCIKCYEDSIISYTYEECYEKAKQYKFLLDFKIENKKMYKYALSKHWIDDYNWINKMSYEDFKDKKRIIYAYEFPNNVAYIGLTNWPERRDNQHRSKIIKSKSSVREYSILNNIEVPEMKILEDNLTIVESQRAEQKWMDIYKQKGWSLINKVKAGSIGAQPSLKYTKEFIIEESKKYKNMQEMREKDRPCYNNMIKLNIKHICFPNSKFIEIINKPYNYTEDFIKEITSKYKTKTELRKNEIRIYKWLHKHGRLYDFYNKPSEKIMNRCKSKSNF